MEHPRKGHVVTARGEELLPCPFCGGEATIDDVSTSYRSDLKPVWGIYCSDQSCSIELWSSDEDRQAAITAWNTRAHTDAQRIAELEAALQWYADKVGDCRKIHREGETARYALDADGGNRARKALARTGSTS
jgi:hypothetical protein